MIRFVSIAAALVASTLLLGATAGHAQPSNGYYAATPVGKPSAKSFITRDTLWKWRDGTFVANKGVERDLIMCSLVAQRAGKLSAFSAGGTALDDATLAVCNTKAK